MAISPMTATTSKPSSCVRSWRAQATPTSELTSSFSRSDRGGTQRNQLGPQQSYLDYPRDSRCRADHSGGGKPVACMARPSLHNCRVRGGCRVGSYACLAITGGRISSRPPSQAGAARPSRDRRATVRRGGHSRCDPMDHQPAGRGRRSSV